MSKHIFEEKPAEGGAPAQTGNAKAVIEKKARQLAYDTRYQVKREMGDKKADPATLQRALITRLQKSNAIPAVKMRAKQMLLGEDYISDLGDLAANTVANALYKVFVEGVQKEEVIELDYLKELAENPDKKYKVSVFDPKSETRYVRYATREKISQLRAKGLKVELTEYGEPRESEAKKGSQTAAALGGGKAKKDYDRDGKVESGAKEHAGAVHNAIQRKRGGVPDGQDTSSVKEELIVDAAATQDQNQRKITGKGVNNSRLIKIMPEDGAEPISARGSMTMSYELSGGMISEKASSKAQQRFMELVNERMNLAKADMGDVIGDFKTSKAPQFRGKSKKKRQQMAIAAKLGAEREAGMREETECNTKKKNDEQQVDPRSIPTKINLLKNKLRSAGIKSPVLMMAAEETVEEGMGLSVGISKLAGNLLSNPRTSAEQGAKNFQKNLADPVGKAVKGAVRSALQPVNMSPEAQKARRDKYRPEEVEFEGEMVDESHKDAVADVMAKNGGPGAFIGTNEFKASQKNKPSQPKPKQKRKLPSYEIPGGSAPGMFRKSYNN